MKYKDFDSWRKRDKDIIMRMVETAYDARDGLGIVYAAIRNARVGIKKKN